MLHFLPAPIVGALSVFLLGLNTLAWSIPLFMVVLLKLVVPWKSWRALCSRVLTVIADGWVLINNWSFTLTKRIHWNVSGLEGLDRKKWYLVISNHQSWADILVLQKVFFRKIPFLKFFLKQKLIWFPVLGQAWWALDMPFMKRHSAGFLEKYPHQKGKDLEATRKACEKFKTMPISVVNFVEGTRFSRDKHEKQESPYKNLLKPKSGGIAFVLAVLGEQLDHILDVTIAYPKGANTFWAFLSGRIHEIRISVKSLSVDEGLLGDYTQDLEFRKRFQDWINGIWEKKDRVMEELVFSSSR